ncbi:MAG: hypothetical protein M0011_10250 [Elusimicrobia bacterium]|nr:hypothetical protein [Elusimicrobiota bacterium]
MEPTKKSSLFSGLFHSEDHQSLQPTPAAPPPSPARAAVPDEQLSALNRKMEALERNIVGQLEKKLSAQVPPPAMPPSPVTPAVLSKISEMEARLKEFHEKFLLAGAAQSKNIEESKAGARREIEELLKVVREQQKYSELDRQMHDQLQKAWSRVEEMEKRLVEAYAAASKKPPEPPPPPAPQVSAEEIAAAVVKVLDARLQEKLRAHGAAQEALAGRFRAMEEALKSVAAEAASAPRQVRALESRIGELSAAVDSRLKSLSSKIEEMGISAFAGKERLEEMVTDVRDELRRTIDDAMERAGGLVKHVDAAALEGRERLDTATRTILAQLQGVSEVQREFLGAAEKLSGDIKEGAEKLSGEMTEGAKKLSGDIARAGEAADERVSRGLGEIESRLRSSVSGQLQETMNVFKASASGRAAISDAASAVSAVESAISGLALELNGMMKALKGVNLEVLLGVSGAIVRKNVEFAARLVKQLEVKAAIISEKKAQLVSDLARLRHENGEK